MRKAVGISLNFGQHTCAGWGSENTLSLQMSLRWQPTRRFQI